tara:strand:+ start:484 stop:819 length:336 start_codon:yes stop_codon:yes gene_type:complete
MNFNENIKQWVALDTEIKNISEILKKKREKKIEILKNIIDYKNNNNLDNILINFNNEKLKFTRYKQQQPISLNFLRETLDEIIKDREQIDYIVEYLKNKRKYKIVEDIKRI